MDILLTIKRLALKRDLLFTHKAQDEMYQDHLTKDMVIEALISAPGIAKQLSSTNPQTGKRDKLYVIVGVTFEGIAIYTKGKISRQKKQTGFLCPRLLEKKPALKKGPKLWFVPNVADKP